MILPVHDAIRRRITAAVQGLYGLAAGEVPAFPIDYPPTRELGDLAIPVAFELARRLRKAPRAIAAGTGRGARSTVPGVARVEADAQRLPERLPRSPGVSP